MRHAHHDFLHSKIAAALDDLFQAPDQRFTAVQPEPLGAGEFEIAEFLKPSASTASSGWRAGPRG